ncbi:ABC-type sugar transport system, substrate-binding protein, contains N-terminal xre family HTH domain [Chitinophaga rupis]|uniref:histidine kinase n=1 Tax=Chitinophaga rupis TaxID=573321 RepID=A0A1H8B078_9BACT|nr:substrate-binding domain-containing protein [Chitinophaga rupis]SEM75564.1 ABC-type sugar transport system, substrate-binding protein, contains N-terminal xre family HTH domain [Chitinophaga rupis]
MLRTFLFFCCLWGLLCSISCRQETAPKYCIGFSQCTGNDDWRRNMLTEMKRELFYHPEMQLLYKDAESDSKRQVQQIRELLAQKMDILLVSPNEATPLAPVIAEVYKKGIPVIILDRKAATDSFTAYIGGDNYNIGKLAAEYIAGQLGGKGRIIEVTGLRGSSPTIERHQGFHDALVRYPGLHLIATLEGSWVADKTQAAAAQHDSALRQADVVFAQNDVMAYGMYRYCRAKGLTRTRFIGVDASPYPDAGIDLVSRRILSASLLYPSGGKEAISMAADILAGKKVPRSTLLQTVLIDSSNVKLMRLQIDKIQAQHQEIEKQQSLLQEQRSLYQDQQHLLRIVATTLCIAFLLGIVLFFILRTNRRINHQLKQQRDEILQQRDRLVEMTAKAQEATEAKFAFFTNVSHEFRTPLTLIQAPLESLMGGRQFSATQKHQLELMHRNVIRLMRLVNQLLEFRRIESGKLQLKVAEQDLQVFMMDIMEAYKSIAVKKHIDFRLINRQPGIKAWFDQHLFDRVLYNLLSNAFKFTSDYGKVHIYLEKPEQAGEVIIRIEDNGAGMDEATLAHAFELFYQSRETAHKGTGIGLALSREIISLHHGTISLKSAKGTGTTFTLTLPASSAPFEPEEIQQEAESMNVLNHSLFNYLEEPEEQQPATTNTGEHLHSILIIEDHPDLNSFLASYLGGLYEVFHAVNGAEGLQLAFQHIPDLILCDIMMPEMDGIQVLETLKKDIRTSHIPVILLSANSSEEQRIKGMQHNADAYISKPFNLQYLAESISSILNNRALLKDHYIAEPETRVHTPQSNKPDRKFVNDFTAIVENNLGNDQFGVDDICQQLSISKMQLYRKVKQLLNCNVNDYILDTRVKKAKYLLVNSQQSVSEIAYACGFSSPAYFSTVFKARSQQTPKTFREQVNKKPDV